MFRVKEEVTDQLSLKVPRAYNPVAEPANFHIVLLSRYFSDLKILFLAIKRSLVFIFPLLLTLLNALYDDGTHDCAVNICKILQVHDIGRRGSRITTDQFPKRAPKTKACVCVGGGGHDPPGNFLDFNFLKSPFPGFGIIQTGYWPVPLADY